MSTPRRRSPALPTDAGRGFDHDAELVTAARHVAGAPWPALGSAIEAGAACPEQVALLTVSVAIGILGSVHLF